MATNLLCDPYFWEKPSVLLRTSIYPTSQRACLSELFNQIVVVITLFGGAGAGVASLTKNPWPLWIAVVFLVYLITPSVLAIYWRTQQIDGFQDAEEQPAARPTQVHTPATVQPAVDVIGRGAGCSQQAAPVISNQTVPTARNPFMNVLIDELKYNPSRPEAVSVLDPNMKLTLDDFFRTEFVRDPTDVFGRSQSQRQFVTMPSTTIPNDQDSYQNWLYRIPGKTCKEGGREACLPGTDGGAIPWLNVDS